VEPPNVDTINRSELELLESSLHGLWEKVKRAGEVIGTLRDENRSLKSRVDQLESELRRVQAELQKKELAVKELQAGASAKAAGTPFADGEREVMLQRAKDLLSRIEAYL
jgi:chromosome segregation ATPase